MITRGSFFEKKLPRTPARNFLKRARNTSRLTFLWILVQPLSDNEIVMMGETDVYN